MRNPTHPLTTIEAIEQGRARDLRGTWLRRPDRRGDRGRRRHLPPHLLPVLPLEERHPLGQLRSAPPEHGRLVRVSARRPADVRRDRRRDAALQPGAHRRDGRAPRADGRSSCTPRPSSPTPRSATRSGRRSSPATPLGASTRHRTRSLPSSSPTSRSVRRAPPTSEWLRDEIERPRRPHPPGLRHGAVRTRGAARAARHTPAAGAQGLDGTALRRALVRRSRTRRRCSSPPP